jgi:uncharacterized protein YjbI with pentapeptide repeats
MRDVVLLGANTQAWDVSKADLRGALTNDPTVQASGEVSLDVQVREHARWCSTGGAAGTPSVFDGVDLRGLKNLRGFNLTAVSARRAVFYGLDMEGIQLQGARLEGADLRGVNLRRADLRGARLTGVMMSGADLRGARLEPLVLEGGRLLPTDLTSADLRRVNFSGADLRSAILNDVDLRQATLTDANLKDAQMEFRESFGLKGAPGSALRGGGA